MLKVSEAIVAEEDEEGRLDRQIEEIDEQMYADWFGFLGIKFCFFIFKLCDFSICRSGTFL